MFVIIINELKKYTNYGREWLRTNQIQQVRLQSKISLILDAKETNLNGLSWKKDPCFICQRTSNLPNNSQTYHENLEGRRKSVLKKSWQTKKRKKRGKKADSSQKKTKTKTKKVLEEENSINWGWIRGSIWNKVRRKISISGASRRKAPNIV
jgi:hypothetical protein